MKKLLGSLRGVAALALKRWALRRFWGYQIADTRASACRTSFRASW